MHRAVVFSIYGVREKHTLRCLKVLGKKFLCGYLHNYG